MCSSLQPDLHVHNGLFVWHMTSVLAWGWSSSGSCIGDTSFHPSLLTWCAVRPSSCSPLRQYPTDGLHHQNGQGTPPDWGQGQLPLPFHQEPGVPQAWNTNGVPGGKDQSHWLSHKDLSYCTRVRSDEWVKAKADCKALPSPIRCPGRWG